MKKSELVIFMINVVCFFGLALLLLSGHSGFASKFVNAFFFVLVIESGIYMIKS